MAINKICVYCASSRQIHDEYYNAAAALGKILARNQINIVYGGGAYGAMGHLADAALAEQGNVIGIIPRFLCDLELAHQKLSQLIIVETMHERKSLMVQSVDAVVALPGGSGTLEELLEAITWKRLGILTKPIILINTRSFYDPLIQLLENMVFEKFMDPRHRQMWQVVDSPEQVLSAIINAPQWRAVARNFAAV